VVLAGKKILIADADGELLEKLKKVFSQEDCKIFTCLDGSHASMLAREELFDAMVIELKLPSVSGLQVAATARSSKKNAKSHIFVCGAAFDADTVSRAKTLGIAEMVVKPFEPTNILHKLKSKFDMSDEGPKTYDVRIINGFLSSVLEVVTFYLETNPNLGKPFVKKGGKTTGYVSGLIGLSGNGVVGSTSLTFERPLLQALAKKVFMNPDIQLSDEIAGDLAGELCNQVCGKVKINFGKLGVKLNIGLPEVVIGEGHMIVHKANSAILSVPVQHSGSQCIAEFCMVTGVQQQIDESKAETAAEGVIMFDD